MGSVSFGMRSKRQAVAEQQHNGSVEGELSVIAVVFASFASIKNITRNGG
jgi:hypothetical protein